MSGKAIVSFQDFVKATNERLVAGPTDILNEAAKNTYLIGDMLDGMDADVVVQSGSKITDRIQLKGGSGFSFYQPNEQFSPTIEDTLTSIECNWRFAKDYWSWTDHEIKLNGGDAKTQYKSLKRAKQQASIVSIYEGMEDALWATPDNAQMESNNGSRPYSIRAFVTEDGLAPSGFSTVMQVNPATEEKWQNQVSPYAYATIDVSLIPAFEDMWHKLRFRAPKKGESAFRDTKFKKFKILTNTDGSKTYVRLTRESNDDATPDLGWAVKSPTFGGIGVEPISALDDVGYTTGQPRYFWLNFEYLYLVMHGERYMFETDPINGGHTQPYSWVVYKDCWYNLFCRSRRRQGIIVPE